MRLEVFCQDRIGLTRELLDLLVERGIDLRGIEIAAIGRIYLNFLMSALNSSASSWPISAVLPALPMFVPSPIFLQNVSIVRSARYWLLCRSRSSPLI